MQLLSQSNYRISSSSPSAYGMFLLAVTSHSPSTRKLTRLHLISIDLPILDIPCKWNHMTNIFEADFSFFYLFLVQTFTDNIPLYAYITFSLSSFHLMTSWIISILGAVINNAAMNIHGKIFMDIHFYFTWVWHWASLVAQRLKCLPAMRETWVQSLGREDPLEKEMATHSSILAWRISWMEEPGGLQSMGSQRVGHDWATSLTHDIGVESLDDMINWKFAIWEISKVLVPFYFPTISMWRL